MMWSFLTTYINAEWPVLLNINANNFDYNAHSTVAFGYNTVRGYDSTGELYELGFVKLYDGWSTSGKRYICWDMLVNYNSFYEPTNSEYISATMIAFCPYQ